MSLLPGMSIGTYQVLEAIGAGGMGEVYRARDTRLQRDVALKVLPALVAGDPDRLARFEREATTLASLNHPNIAQVHGLTEKPVALVMELVPGEDLAARLTRGAIPLDEAMGVARQIANALEAAHEQGIVHRDLKPANVRVRPDGTVKVLDFGLAKAATGTAAADSLSAQMNSPTVLSPAMTQLGVILGTAAYMAPEQARGKPVDRRADIWAFGCVLYEMLTAVAPFHGDDVSLTLAAILTTDPDFTKLPAATPPAIRRLLRRCLDKDPARRLASIADARLELDEVEPSPTVSAPIRARTSGVRTALLTIAALAAGAAGTWIIMQRSAAGSVPQTTPDFVLKRLTELPGAETAPDISPDGREIVFSSSASGHANIYLLRVGGARAINLTEGSTSDDRQATFSADGERIAFRSERDGGGIFVMGSTGESVRRVTTAGYDPAWSPDGKAIAYATEGVLDPYARNGNSSLWVANVATGHPTRIVASDAVQPAWSPDGRRIAYWANIKGQRDLWSVAADGGTPVPVTSDAATDWSPEWSPDGKWLYFSSDRGGNMNVWRVAMTEAGTAAGEPEAVTRSFTGVGYARVSADASKIIVMAYSRSYELSLAPFDAAAGRLGTSSTIRSSSIGWCSPSPTADWLACTSRGAREDIVLMRADGAETIRLMDDGFKDRNPTWSPDGSRIAFMSTRSGAWQLWTIGRDGSDLRQMTDFATSIYEAVWSPDGKEAMTSDTSDAATGSSLTWRFSTNTLASKANASEVVAQPPFNAELWSPDMKRGAVALVGIDGVAQAVGVLDLATKAIRKYDVPILPNQDYRIVAGWLTDSRRFLVPTPAGIAIVDADTAKWTTIPAPLAGTLYRSGTRYRLSNDTRTLMVERAIYDGDVWLLEMKR